MIKTVNMWLVVCFFTERFLLFLWLWCVRHKRCAKSQDDRLVTAGNLIVNLTHRVAGPPGFLPVLPVASPTMHLMTELTFSWQRQSSVKCLLCSVLISNPDCSAESVCYLNCSHHAAMKHNLTSTLILFSPYTDSPTTMFLVTRASSFPLEMNTPE